MPGGTSGLVFGGLWSTYSSLPLGPPSKSVQTTNRSQEKGLRLVDDLDLLGRRPAVDATGGRLKDQDGGGADGES